MKIALLLDEYLPSPRIHVKMMHELAIELKNKGYEPIVIAPSNKKQKKLLQKHNYDGIEAWLFRSGKIHTKNKVVRAFNESLLSINAYIATFKELRNSRVNLCINYSPSIFFGPYAKSLKSNGAKVYLVLRDLFPQWTVELGLLKEGSIIHRYFKFFEKLNYEAADCIGVMSEGNKQILESLNPKIGKIEVLRNWTNRIHIERKSNSNFLSDLEINNKKIFFYGGTMGKGQDIFNLIKLIKYMKKYNDAHFLFVGEGDDFQKMLELKNELNLSNMTVKSSVDEKTYEEILQNVDIGLISLSTKHTSHNIPGKLLGYMTSSLPILGIANKENDVIDLINSNEVGYITSNTDDKKLFQQAEAFYNSEKLRHATGRNSKDLLYREFTSEMALNKILKIME